jgi:hypothetical protein
MKTVMFSKVERRVAQNASRQARRQLMLVPWDRFHKTYEEYVRWQAFALWARTVVESKGRAPAWLKTILRKRCPGFVEEANRSNQPELLAVQLLPWIQAQTFGFTRSGGWLDALVFYGFRDIRAQAYWTYWEHCICEWKEKEPASVPAFAEWRRSALNSKLQGDVSFAIVRKAVEKYIAFEAIAYWLRPLLGTPTIQLPANVILKLRQESPRLLEFVKREVSAANEGKSGRWQRLFRWGRDHVLTHAKSEGWLDQVLPQIEIHPRHVRLTKFSALWCKSWLENPELPYPSLRPWLRDAEGYVRASPK